MPYPRTEAAKYRGDGKLSPYCHAKMAYDPGVHHRRSIRLRGYDYSGGGAYYITINTQNKACVFGQIVEGEMVMNEAGLLVQRIWEALPQRFVSLILDAFQIMPNHLHAVFVLPGPGLEPALAKALGAPVIQPSPASRGRACPPLFGDRQKEVTASRPPAGLAIEKEDAVHRSSDPRTSMGDIVGAFKSICTIAVNKLMSRTGTRLLHENFYEHIIRDVDELETIRDYIIQNPKRWNEDSENPDRT
ncbi:MAG TPA: hypothetical protein VKV95_02365 [Terriglobia bacterium]|nr:hypothetical protein [Terriglobia bacterium]